MRFVISVILVVMVIMVGNGVVFIISLWIILVSMNSVKVVCIIFLIRVVLECVCSDWLIMIRFNV